MMKKILKITFVLFTLLAISVSTVFAGQAIELVEVRNGSAGPTFIFRVYGEFTRDELNDGFVHVNGGDDYTLHCGQVHGDTVTCHTTKKAGGHNVVIGFGNARFWTYVPLATYCYSIWDWRDVPSAEWTNFGTNCGDKAQVGDVIEYYNQYSAAYQSVTFFDIYTPLFGTCAVVGQPPSGPAYYFPLCP